MWARRAPTSARGKATPLRERMNALVTDLNVCSNKGLSERFDSTIGAATVLMPFGGKNQLTPAQAMVAKLPVGGETTTCSGMAWGFNPYLTEADQFTGSYVAVVESRRASLVAAGFKRQDMYLTFQEYFEKPARRPEALGQARGCRAGRAHGAGRPGHRLHRRQGLHVRQLRAARCAAHAGVLRHGGGQGRPRDVPEFKGAGHRVALVAPPLLRRRGHRACVRGCTGGHGRRAGAHRQRRRAGGLHAGLRLHGRVAVQDVRGQRPGREARRRRRRRAVRACVRQLPGGAGRRRAAARRNRQPGRGRAGHHHRGLSLHRRGRGARHGRAAGGMGGRHRERVPVPRRRARP